MTDTPNRPPLSPAAQAVADAYDNTPEKPTGNHRYHWLAAALRAAADQVVPEPDDAAKETFSIAALRHRWQIRDQFLAIAVELEGTTRDPLEPNDLSHLSDEEFKALAPQGYHGL